MTKKIIGNTSLGKMHKIWIDTNILIDHLLFRKPFDTFALDLIAKIDGKRIIAHTSIINLIHAHYQVRKTTDELATREMIKLISEIVTVYEISDIIHTNALLNTKIKDFEDAVQYELALSSASDFFITRNLKDFPVSAPFVVCDAETYLNKYRLIE